MAGSPSAERPGPVPGGPPAEPRVPPGGPPAGRPAASGGLPAERPDSAPIRHEELEAIIRRAAELQFDAGGDEGAVDEGELVRIGEEVGLDARFVRQALAERRAAALLPALPEDAGLPARLWGGGFVQATRVVPGERDEVVRQIEAWLREGETLRQVRDRPGSSVWEPASDVWSEIQRGFDFSGRGYQLAGARRLELRVEPLEPGRSLVILTADIRNRRSAHALAWLLLGSLPAGLAAAALVVTGLDASAALAFPAAGTAAIAAGGWAAGRTFRRRRARVEETIEGLLDRLEQGAPPRPPRRGWLGRLGFEWRGLRDDL